MARRFSWLATVGIATVAVSGLLRAISEVGTIDALFSTDFGRLAHREDRAARRARRPGCDQPLPERPRRRSRADRSPAGRLGRDRHRRRRSCCWPPRSSTSRRRPPPRPRLDALTDPEPRPRSSSSGTDFGTSVRSEPRDLPGLTGFNTFRATVTDYDSGAPVAAERRHAALLDPGPDRRRELAARPRADGTSGVFSATGGNLSLDGLWQITATVARGTASVEVPLTRPRADDAANRSTSTGSPGIPTIYTVHLSAGRTVQVYLDPDKPGTNDFHVTFFDAAGTSCRRPTSAPRSATASAAPQQLTLRNARAGPRRRDAERR